MNPIGPNPSDRSPALTPEPFTGAGVTAFRRPPSGRGADEAAAMPPVCRRAASRSISGPVVPVTWRDALMAANQQPLVRDIWQFFQTLPDMYYKFWTNAHDLARIWHP